MMHRKIIACLFAAALLFLPPRQLFGQNEPQKLRVGADGRFLTSENGDPVFLLGDTAWGLSWDLDRESVDEYLDLRRAQGFNAVAIVGSGWRDGLNVYGDRAFESAGGKSDPLRRITTPGADPDDSHAYDYWDHLDFCIDQAAARDIYVVLLPTWGEAVAGSWSGEDTSGIVFDAAAAYDYGRWIGSRYGDRSHVLWMIGGDRSPIYVKEDYRPVFRAMAEGVADGVHSNGRRDGAAMYDDLLMSYHPRKEQPNSSHWFHRDPWLSFNSIQDWPEDQVAAVFEDRSRLPHKPTWLFEGRYEGYHRGGYSAADWGAWQVRYQAYQTVFAGAFGTVYGHENVFGFGEGWRESVGAPGATQMQHLRALMELWPAEPSAWRMPDQQLIEGDPGVTRRLTSDRVQALRGGNGEMAMIYTANGRPIDVQMEHLAGASMDAYWFDPRSALWYDEDAEGKRRPFASGISSGRGAPVHRFDPPGEERPENDWVLVLQRSP